MPQQRLPSIASYTGKTRVKAAPAHRQKGARRQASSSSSSSSHPPLGPGSILSDSAMTPWGGLPLSEASFASIAAPPPPRARAPPPPPPPPPPPAPQPTPATPRCGGPIEEEPSGSRFSSGVPSPPLTVYQNRAAGGGRQLQARRRALSQRRAPRPPRLPPLRPVTNLSFSRSFTFSFFELPLHQSPGGHAERTRNLMLLLRQIHF